MVQDPVKLYGNDLVNIRHSLGRMVQQSYIDAKCNRNEASQMMRGWLDTDRRFDSYDKSRLLQKVDEAGKSGSRLDLTDPWLFGGDKRPLSR
jgi:hypothetical protein